MCGAGLSHGLVPLPKEIVEQRVDAANKKISATTGEPFPALSVAKHDWDALYVWAQVARNELQKIHHPCPKLAIAQALGLTSDAKWLAGAGRPITQAEPRHRVIARLAREARWQSLWTFNWDCHIEAALESIGLREQDSVPNQPWPVRYQRVISLSDYGALPKDRTVIVHKRHGCIRQLLKVEQLEVAGKATAADYGAVRLLIAKDELDEVLDKSSDDYKSFRGQLAEAFAGNPLFVCGWSAGEKYLLEELEASSELLRKYPVDAGRLSIVDPEFNAEGHQRLSTIYGVPKPNAYFPISPAAGMPSANELFLWIQTIYALSEVFKASDRVPAVQAEIGRLLNEVRANCQPSVITSWADSFLSRWVQLAWRCGLVTARHRNVPMRPEDIRLEGDEWYVPLSQDLPERPELITAARLLLQVLADASHRDLALVPGCIYDARDARLAVPLPAWSDLADANVLNSLSRLADRVSAARGFIRSIWLLPVTLDGNPLTVAKKDNLASVFTGVIRDPATAHLVHDRVIDLADL